MRETRTVAGGAVAGGAAADSARILLNDSAAHDRARHVFAGLVPQTPALEVAPQKSGSAAAARVRSAAMTSVPMVLTGAIALGLGLSGPVDVAHARKPLPPKPPHSPEPISLRSALSQLGAVIVPGALAASAVTSRAAPAVYTVEAGDTVSNIAEQHGLSTATVLALNGLSWRSIIFAGQQLRLTTAPVKTTAHGPAVTQAGRYRIIKGDTVSTVAARFGVSTASILDANGLEWSSIIYPGQSLLIPGRELAPQPAVAPIIGVAVDAPRPAPRPTAGGTDPATPAPATASVAASVATMPVAETAALPAGRPAVSAGVGSNAPVAPPAVGGPVTPLTAEMRTHAATIIRVGHELSVPQYGIVIALATAMQESSLRNLSWGDRDSVGLFQQRPSSGWGSAADLQVPSHAARLFYVGRPGFTRGLLGISGWHSMTLTQAAQAVQISAYPNHYAKWEASAWAWYYELT